MAETTPGRYAHPDTPPGHVDGPDCPLCDRTAASLAADQYGRLVRETWVAWAREQPDVAEHPSWLVGWDDLPERDREVDRRIGAAVAEAGRADERERIADLLTEHRDTIARFADGKERLVGLIAHLLRLRQEVGR